MTAVNYISTLISRKLTGGAFCAVILYYSFAMKKTPKSLPNSPGVYFFLGGKKFLYIGKATNLRDRVKSYFSIDLVETRGPSLVKMLAEATGVRCEKTGSVLEALILEARLIKKHQPRYNTKDKSDKSFYFVVVTKENFPRVLLMRGKELADSTAKMRYTFGPFPNSTELREALKIVRKIFPFRDTCIPCEHHYDIIAKAIMKKNTGISRGDTKSLCKPCFNRQIGLCPGVCTGEISQKEYARTINLIRLFFLGKHSHILKNVRVLMKRASAAREFEKATKYRNQIFALEHINDVALIKRESNEVLSSFRIEAFDIAHISGMSTVGSMVVMVGGGLAKQEYKRFKMRGKSADKSDDTGNLRELLKRRFAHKEWGRPDLLVIDGSTAQRNVAETVLRECGFVIPIVSVVKDEHHRPKDIVVGQNNSMSKIMRDYRHDILRLNAEAHRFAITYHKKLRDRVE